MDKLVKTLMTLRGLNQLELSKRSGVSIAALSRFLSGAGDLRADSLVKVLTALGADVETFVKNEINKALGNDNIQTLSEDLSFVLQNAKPITRRTIADFLVARIQKDKSPETRTRLARIKRFADSIETVRRTN